MVSEADLNRSSNPRKNTVTPTLRPTSLPTNTSSAQLRSNVYGKTPHNSPRDDRPKPRKRPHSPITSGSPDSSVAPGALNNTEHDQYSSFSDREIHAQKRTRSAEWQSHGSWKNEANEPASSADNEGDHFNPGRPSRFLEGSMNDRVSNTLPSLYLQDERAMDQIHNGATHDQTKRLTHHPNNSISHTSAGNESTKSSGFFRFGKAVASAFNPVHIWQGLNVRSRDKQEPVGHQEAALLKERQAKAEKAYADLKQSGFKGAKGVPQARYSSDLPITKSEQDTGGPQASLQRDSGIDVDGYRSSGELGGNGGIHDSNDYLLPPPPIPGFGRAASPASDLSSKKNSFTHLRSPSLQSLRNAISQVHLPTAKRQADSLGPPLALAHNASLQDVTDQKSLKSQRSRKELEKQEKLGKKVSDLEAKLSSARRDLDHAMGNDSLPRHLNFSRKHLVSGGLPSLSSVSLVNRKTRDPSVEKRYPNKPQTEAAKDLDAALASSKARSSEQHPKPDKAIVEPKTTFSGRAVANLEQHKRPDSKKPGTKKRKSSGGAENDLIYKPDTDGDDDAEWEVGKVATVKKSGRSRKSQKVEKDEVMVHHDKSTVDESQPTYKPERRTAAQIEPQRVIKTFEPEAVDKSKIMMMRPKGSREEPFGQLTEDIVNLRKEYPGVTDKEVVNYIASLLLPPRSDEKEETYSFKINAPLDPLIEEKENPGIADSKIEVHQHSPPKRLRKTYSEKTLTKHTSVAHLNEPPPTFLGRPRSTSPLKKDNRLSPRLFSPPPSADYSKPANLSATTDDAISVSPAKDGNIPPIPNIPRDLEGHVRPVKPVKPGVGTGEAMSDAEKEQYEWPEDVF